MIQSWILIIVGLLCWGSKIKTSTQPVLYINYFSWFLWNHQFFNNSFYTHWSETLLLIQYFYYSFVTRLFTFALIILHDRYFNIGNLLWESSIIVSSGSTRFWILLLKYDWTVDNSSDVHSFLQLSFDHPPLRALENRCNYTLSV